MLTVEYLKKVIVPQNIKFNQPEEMVTREVLPEIGKLTDTPHVIIISGLRRSGKSTLIKQINEKFYSERFAYLNFDDEKLLNFKPEDFTAVYETFLELNEKVEIMFFDEIQNVTGWEAAIRRLHNEKIKIFITGSNASLLSRELGTRLTGRHLDIVLYPFSFKEYLVYRNISVKTLDLFTPQKTALIKKEFAVYFRNGGIPEYVRYGRDEIIKQLYEDILIKDIIVRYSIGDEKSFRELARLLISNTGKLFSYNRLKEALTLGSLNTVKSYISYMENSYLLFQVEKFDSSLRKQIINNKKIYCIDNAFLNLVTFETTENIGRKLENMVFVELKRRGYSVHYFREKWECDFIVSRNMRAEQAIQVCYELNVNNRERELNGLREAMLACNINDGIILTYGQEEYADARGIEIKILPVWKWLLQ